jgi:predicted lipopolysaccharide heptosyltransferase III
LGSLSFLGFRRVGRAPIASGLNGKPIHRILLIKPSSLGDIVHALPVLNGLRRRFPKATIDWLVSTTWAPFLANHPQIDSLVPFDRIRYGHLGREASATADFFRLLSRLRGRRYDLVVDLQGLFRTGFLAWVTGAPLRIGFADAREGAWPFYSHRLPPEAEDIHAVDRYYRVAQWLGFTDVPTHFDLGLTSAERVEARQLLREAGIELRGTTLIAVAPGARWETKVWLPERFAAVIDALQNDPGVRCVLLGGPDEISRCARIGDTCRTPVTNLAGRSSLRALTALLDCAAVVLCHDSAVTHLAVALDRPLVCLVGPTNPCRTGPYRRLEDVLRIDLECSPCYLRRIAECRFNHRCMADLSVEPVLEAVRRRFAHSLTGRLNSREETRAGAVPGR